VIERAQVVRFHQLTQEKRTANSLLQFPDQEQPPELFRKQLKVTTVRCLFMLSSLHCAVRLDITFQILSEYRQVNTSHWFASHLHVCRWSAMCWILATAIIKHILQLPCCHHNLS